jgi:hypothetical protein
MKKERERSNQRKKRRINGKGNEGIKEREERDNERKEGDERKERETNKYRNNEERNSKT